MIFYSREVLGFVGDVLWMDVCFEGVWFEFGVVKATNNDIFLRGWGPCVTMQQNFEVCVFVVGYVGCCL